MIREEEEALDGRVSEVGRSDDDDDDDTEEDLDGSEEDELFDGDLEDDDDDEEEEERKVSSYLDEAAALLLDEMDGRSDAGESVCSGASSSAVSRAPSAEASSVSSTTSSSRYWNHFSASSTQDADGKTWKTAFDQKNALFSTDELLKGLALHDTKKALAIDLIFDEPSSEEEAMIIPIVSPAARAEPMGSWKRPLADAIKKNVSFADDGHVPDDTARHHTVSSSSSSE